MMVAAVRRNVRRGGRVDRHAADWIGRAPAAFFRALMIVHRRRSRTCLMLPDGGAVRTPPVEFADGVFPGGSRMEPLLLIRKNGRSEEHTSELQSLMRISYAVFCLKKKK